MATLAATAASGRSVSGDANPRLPHLDQTGTLVAGCDNRPGKPQTGGRLRLLYSSDAPTTLEAGWRAVSVLGVDAGPSGAAQIVDRDREGQEQWFVLALSDLDTVGVAHRNHFFDTVAMTSSSRLTSYSWSTTLPCALRSLPSSMSMSKRSRIPTRALWIVASVRPSRSICIVSRAELLLLDRRYLVAVTVLEDEGVADPQGLAVDLVDALALVVLDPRVIADRNELLLDLEAPTARSIVAVLKGSDGCASLGCRLPRP